FLLSAVYGYLRKENPISYEVVYLANKETKAPVLSEFDPNNLPAEEWRKMGFSENQVKVIKNYEAKGGKFYTKKDVAKIYSISDEEYARIEPYIRIKPDNRPRRNAYKKH